MLKFTDEPYGTAPDGSTLGTEYRLEYVGTTAMKNEENNLTQAKISLLIMAKNQIEKELASMRFAEAEAEDAPVGDELEPETQTNGEAIDLPVATTEHLSDEG